MLVAIVVNVAGSGLRPGCVALLKQRVVVPWQRDCILEDTCFTEPQTVTHIRSSIPSEIV